MRTKFLCSFILVMFITISGYGQKQRVQFISLGKLYAWEVKSVTYLGTKNGGYNIRIKGIATNNLPGGLLSEKYVDIGFYRRNNDKIKNISIIGTYLFPNVRKGELFSLDVVIWLPKNMTPKTIGGITFSGKAPFIEEEEQTHTQPLPSNMRSVIRSATENYQTKISSEEMQDLKNEEKKTISPLTSSEVMPSYPGGKDELQKFLHSNLKYPTVAAENGIAGRVVLRFVVKGTGEIGDITVTNSLDPSCDKEGIRLIRSMPNWNPGMQDGKPVDVYFTLGISFSLN